MTIPQRSPVRVCEHALWRRRQVTVVHVVFVVVVLHQQTVGGVTTGGCGDVADLHVVVVRRSAVGCGAELAAVVETADEENDAEEGGDGGADGDVEDLDPCCR